MMRPGGRKQWLRHDCVAANLTHLPQLATAAVVDLVEVVVVVVA